MNIPDAGVYRTIIKKFVDRLITVEEFERTFLRTFKTLDIPLSEDEFLILDELFGDVDSYCPDPELRDPIDLDEQQLLERAELALRKLDSARTN